MAIHPFFLLRLRERLAGVIESRPMSKRCKKQSTLGLALLISLLLIACTPSLNSDEFSTTSIAEEGALVTPSASPTLPAVEDQADASPTPLSLENPRPAVLNPLTGLYVEDAERLERRPILIKVTLYPRNNRPQWGLSSADIVYEHYTEGGLTRFSALFYGQEAEMVGPIRSARLVDIQLVRMYGALFAYGSADQRVLAQIDASEFAERAVREFPAGCPPLCRIDPTTQNHLVTDTRALQAFYQQQGVDLSVPDLTGMHFQQSSPEDGEEGLWLWVQYSEDDFHTWRYVAEEGEYQRFQESGEAPEEVIQLSDRLTDEPIRSANVVLLKVPHDYYARTPEIVDIQLYGEGDGFALRDGKLYPVRWIRPFPEGVLYLENPDGSSFAMKPGVTWFELVGVSSQVIEEGDGGWRVHFSPP